MQFPNGRFFAADELNDLDLWQTIRTFLFASSLINVAAWTKGDGSEDLSQSIGIDMGIDKFLSGIFMSCFSEQIGFV